MQLLVYLLAFFNPYSGVKTSIILLDSELAKKSKNILFIKIENDGYNLGAQRTAINGSQLEQAISDLKVFKNNQMEGSDFLNSEISVSIEKSKILSNDAYSLVGDKYTTLQDLSDVKYPIVSIGEIFKTGSGGTPLKKHEEYYLDGTIPWLRSGEVSQGFIYNAEINITEEALKNSSAKIFPIDTVLVAMYGATAGQVGILKFEASTNQAICGIYPNDKVIPEYLYLILKSQKDYMISLSGGGAQPNISQKIIRELKIPLPSIEVQKEIVKTIDELQNEIWNYQESIVEKENQITETVSKVWGK